MYYFDIRNTVVWTECPPNMGFAETESFTPTRSDLVHGFLVWFDYTTYDSFQTDPGISYCVVDLYENYKSAEKMAKLIREWDEAAIRWSGSKMRTQEEIEKDFFFAATSDRTPYLPLGWGTNLKDIYVDEVDVKELDDKMKRQRIF